MNLINDNLNKNEVSVHSILLCCLIYCLHLMQLIH